MEKKTEATENKDEQYHLTYMMHAHPEGISKSEVKAQGLGGCDCCVFISVLGQPGGPGSLSVAFPSLNGFKGEGEGVNYPTLKDGACGSSPQFFRLPRLDLQLSFLTAVAVKSPPAWIPAVAAVF